MHEEVQDLCPVTWEIFLGNPNANSRVHEDTIKKHQPDIRYQYEVEGLIVADGYVSIKIIKVIYRLHQKAIIAYNQIILYMDPHGYYPVPFITILKTRIIIICLCVDDSW